VIGLIRSITFDNGTVIAVIADSKRRFKSNGR
jgi:hypothetical protein